MRTLAYLTILALFVLLVTSADAINYQHSFYSQGGQVTLDIDSTKLLVQLDTTLSAPAADSVLMSYSAIQQVLHS